MSKKSFLALCVVAAVAVVLAFVAVLSQPRPVATITDRRPLFPELIKNVDNLKTVVIHHGEETTTLDWDGKVWRNRERNNFPADPAKLTNLVVRLAQMAKLEPKTKQADRYNRLDLEDPKAKDSKAQQVILLDGAGKELANVIIGKTKSSSGDGQEGGTYIRLPNDPQTWLAAGELSLGQTPAEWLPRDVLDIPDSAVKSVTVTHPNGEKIVVFKADPTDKNYTVENLPKGTKLPDPAVANNDAKVLAGFTFDDVAPAASKPFPKDKTVTAVVEGFTGFKVNLEMLMEKENAWVKLQGTPPAPRATPAAPAGVHVTDLRNDWDKIIADLNTKADGWVFRVPLYQVEALNRHMSDLLKKPDNPDMGAPQGMPLGAPPG